MPISNTSLQMTPDWNVTSSQVNTMSTPFSEHIRASSSSAAGSHQAVISEFHPFLSQFVSLQPPTEPLIDFAFRSMSNEQTPTLDQSVYDAFVPFAWDEQIPFNHSQIRTPSQVGSSDFTDNFNSFSPGQQLHSEATFIDATTLDTWGANDMTELMSIDSDMSEQWMAFMKECGTVNPATFTT